MNEKQISEVLKALYNPTSNCHDMTFTYSELKGLVSLGIANLNERQNESPSILEFLEFCESAMTSEEEVIFEGYIVTNREDSRVSITTIRLVKSLASARTVKDFFDKFSEADEFDNYEDHYRAWWD